MKFLDKINEQWNLISEEGEPTQDAAVPDPNAPPVPAEGEPTPIAPGGYVDLVKLLAKAMAMNFPAGALDEIFRADITPDNTFSMQTALEAAIKQNEMYADNSERLQNIHYSQFVDSVNTGNFIKKYKQLLTSMKKQDPYLKTDVNL
jgi:hypothetical protein